MLWHQTPSRKKKATVTMSAYQDQLNAGFSEVCEIFKVHCFECLKYVHNFYNPVCYCGDISTPLNITWHKTKHDWLLLPICQSYGLLGRLWPFKAAKVPRPSAISLKAWLHETRLTSALVRKTFFNFCCEQRKWCYATDPQFSFGMTSPI